MQKPGHARMATHIFHKQYAPVSFRSGWGISKLKVTVYAQHVQSVGDSKHAVQACCASTCQHWPKKGT